MDTRTMHVVRQAIDRASPGWPRIRIVIEHAEHNVEVFIHPPRFILQQPTDLAPLTDGYTPFQPTGCRADILTVLRAAGQRLTTNRILDALEEAGMIHGESTVKMALAEMVRSGILSNDNRAEPKGYAVVEARLIDPI
jgi:hypothetical protein